MNLTYRGVDLASFGVITLVDGLHSSPKEQDGALEIIGRHGKLYRPGMLEPRKIVVGLTMADSTLAQLNAKVEDLRKLQYRGLSTLQYQEDGNIRTCQAELVEVSVALSNGPIAKATLEFAIPGTYFFGTALQSQEVQITASPTNFYLTHSGTLKATLMKITLSGPLQNPRVDNLTNGVWLGFTGSINSGGYILVDSEKFTVVDSSGISQLPNFVHSGSTYFFELVPGSNQIQVTTETLGGKIKFEFYPHY